MWIGVRRVCFVANIRGRAGSRVLEEVDQQLPESVPGDGIDSNCNGQSEPWHMATVRIDAGSAVGMKASTVLNGLLFVILPVAGILLWKGTRGRRRR